MSVLSLTCEFNPSLLHSTVWLTTPDGDEPFVYSACAKDVQQAIALALKEYPSDTVLAATVVVDDEKDFLVRTT